MIVIEKADQNITDLAICMHLTYFGTTICCAKVIAHALHKISAVYFFFMGSLSCRISDCIYLYSYYLQSGGLQILWIRAKSIRIVFSALLHGCLTLYLET